METSILHSWKQRPPCLSLQWSPLERTHKATAPCFCSETGVTTHRAKVLGIWTLPLRSGRPTVNAICQHPKQMAIKRDQSRLWRKESFSPSQIRTFLQLSQWVAKWLVFWPSVGTTWWEIFRSKYTAYNTCPKNSAKSYQEEQVHYSPPLHGGNPVQNGGATQYQKAYRPKIVKRFPSKIQGMIR